MRYFLLDRITEAVPGSHARGLKCVTLTDDVLSDHFPGYPLMPGALTVEAMAQLAGYLVEVSFNTKDKPPLRALLVQVDNAKFHKPAEPGDTIVIEAHLEQCMSDAAKVTASAEVLGQKVATAKLSFYLKEIDCPRIHEQRRQLYEIWTRHLPKAPEII